MSNKIKNIDRDCAALANIEEWERSGYRMDYDRDTIPNFYDVDDDDDELPTSVELSVDHDGLDNLRR